MKTATKVTYCRVNPLKGLLRCYAVYSFSFCWYIIKLFSGHSQLFLSLFNCRPSWSEASCDTSNILRTLICLWAWEDHEQTFLETLLRLMEDREEIPETQHTCTKGKPCLTSTVTLSDGMTDCMFPVDKGKATVFTYLEFCKALFPTTYFS